MKNNKIIQPILNKMQDIILEIFEMLYEGHSLDKCVDSYTKQIHKNIIHILLKNLQKLDSINPAKYLDKISIKLYNTSTHYK